MTYAVGLMAGTSLDGVDAALIKITPHSQKSKQVSVRLCDWITRSYPQELKSRLLTLSYVPSEKYKNKQPRDPLSDLCELNFLLGEFFAKTTLALLKKNNRSPEKISFIGSHGQTIRHLGSRGTLQIGEPSVIAEKTGILTVADFRPRDIAAGGHGAPLTPYVNALLFRDAKKARVIQNIGGIGNVTYLPPGEGFKGVTGFDTGPGNMLIDGLMRHFTQGRRHYDEDGRFAGKGWVCLKLLHQWMTEPFFKKTPPKSAGREEFGEHRIPELLKAQKKYRLRDEDLLATVTAWTASSIGDAYRHFIPNFLPAKRPLEDMIICGGGKYNKTLLRMIQSELPEVKIRFSEDWGYSSDALEAVSFALLAHQTLNGVENNCPEVTGARHPVIMGKVVPGKLC